MRVAHSYNIDADLESGWYYQLTGSDELYGPFTSEQGAEDEMWIEIHKAGEA